MAEAAMQGNLLIRCNLVYYLAQCLIYLYRWQVITETLIIIIVLYDLKKLSKELVLVHLAWKISGPGQMGEIPVKYDPFF